MLMLQPRFLKAFCLLLTSSAYFLALLLLRKFFTTRINSFHASSSTSFIKFSNSGSLMSCQMWGPSKDALFQLLRGHSWKKPSTSKWSSHHPYPEPWWTAWLSRVWCAAAGRVFCPLSTRGSLMAFLSLQGTNSSCKASSFSFNAKHSPYYRTCTENIVL